MALLTKQTGNTNTDFDPAPAGDFQMVVADVCDLGWIEKTFEGKSQGLKPHVQFVYSIVGTDDANEPVLRDDGKPFLVFGRRLVLSTNERSGFYKELCGIIGKAAFDAALNAGTLDTEDLIGKNVNGVVVHVPSADGSKTYANIESMKPWNPKYGPNLPVSDYTRRHERPDYQAPEVSAFDPLTGNLQAVSDSLKAGTPIEPRPLPANLQTSNAVVADPKDPRLSNASPKLKDFVKSPESNPLSAKVKAKAAIPADDDYDEADSIFDDDVTDERRTQLLEDPTPKANAGYPAN